MEARPGRSPSLAMKAVAHATLEAAASLGNKVSAALDVNTSTLSGAIDIVVVRQPDGSLRSTPFHVRFGKLMLLKPREKIVSLTVNQKPVELWMKLGYSGEAFFIEEASIAPLPLSELASPPPDGATAEDLVLRAVEQASPASADPRVERSSAADSFADASPDASPEGPADVLPDAPFHPPPPPPLDGGGAVATAVPLPARRPRAHKRTASYEWKWGHLPVADTSPEVTGSPTPTPSPALLPSALPPHLPAALPRGSMPPASAERMSTPGGLPEPMVMRGPSSLHARQAAGSGSGSMVLPEPLPVMPAPANVFARNALLADEPPLGSSPLSHHSQPSPPQPRPPTPLGVGAVSGAYPAYAEDELSTRVGIWSCCSTNGGSSSGATKDWMAIPKYNHRKTGAYC